MQISHKTSKETQQKILKQILRQEATGEAGKTTYASLCGPKKAFEAESASAAAAAIAQKMEMYKDVLNQM